VAYFLCGCNMEIHYGSMLMGFVIGATVYRIVSSIIDLGQIGLYIREAEKHALVMLATSAESIAYIQTIKYNTMKDLGMAENLIKTTKNVDDFNFDKWTNAAISSLLAAYPERFRGFPRYVDWATGMDVLNKIYKKGHMEK
jgi:hypothetical protein